MVNWEVKNIMHFRHPGCQGYKINAEVLDSCLQLSDAVVDVPLPVAGVMTFSLSQWRLTTTKNTNTVTYDACAIVEAHVGMLGYTLQPELPSQEFPFSYYLDWSPTPFYPVLNFLLLAAIANLFIVIWGQCFLFESHTMEFFTLHVSLQHKIWLEPTCLRSSELRSWMDESFRWCWRWESETAWNWLAHWRSWYTTIPRLGAWYVLRLPIPDNSDHTYS